MAPRLTVIISQAAARESAVANFEEQVIAELLMSDGMDANLVGPLETIEPDSTDWLCLSGFRGSLAIVSWLTTEQIAKHWARLGLAGVVRRYGTHASGSGQAIIHVPISTGMRLDDVTGSLKQLLIDRSVKTVGIGLPSKASSPAVSQSVQPKTPPVGARPSSKPSGLQARPHAVTEGIPMPDDEEEDWPTLDKLVDDFDALDL